MVKNNKKAILKSTLGSGSVHRSAADRKPKRPEGHLGVSSPQGEQPKLGGSKSNSFLDQGIDHMWSSQQPG